MSATVETTFIRLEHEDAITWERLANARPILSDLFDTANRLQRRSPGYCANRTFYRVLKPIICETVGWAAKLHCGPHLILGCDLGKPIKHTGECPDQRAKQAWLKTSEAYDLAYDTIYEALPNCQHGMGGCW